MSFSNPLTEREKALEDAFFREQNARLVEALRAKQARTAQQDALSRVLGVRDESIVAPLVALGVRAESVTALVLAPLVVVAWADHRLEAQERQAILAAEQHYGIEPGSEAAKLLEGWLEARPHESLLESWAAYVQALCKVLKPAERDRLRDEVVGRAERITEAFKKTFLRAGATNSAEEEVLTKIRAAFSGAGA